jgi:hypothetical protein
MSQCQDLTDQEFVKRKLSGRIIELKDIRRGKFDLRIKDVVTGDTLFYSLWKYAFIRENNILIGDSIAKEANSRSVVFYKKANGKYQNHADLFY